MKLSEKQISEYRSITIMPVKSEEPSIEIHDPTFASVFFIPMSPEFVKDVALIINRSGIKIEGTSSGANYSYIFLTKDFKTPLK